MSSKSQDNTESIDGGDEAANASIDHINGGAFIIAVVLSTASPPNVAGNFVPINQIAFGFANFSRCFETQPNVNILRFPMLFFVDFLG